MSERETKNPPRSSCAAHMELLGCWLRRLGRLVALYTDRHSIFEPQDKGRALRQLDIGLIRAHSPQAKGRVERLFETAQDRWVKELRLAQVRTCVKANEVLARLLPAHNRRFSKPARDNSDAHRPLGPGHDLGAILSIQTKRVVANDYTVRFRNRFYQLLPPALPGQRGGEVVIEERLDGSMHIRFGRAYLKYKQISGKAGPGGSAPRPPEFNALAADARGEEDPAPNEGGQATGMQPAGGRSGCTPAGPYPPDGEAESSAKPKKRPAQDHPWRKSFKPKK